MSNYEKMTCPIYEKIERYARYAEMDGKNNFKFTVETSVPKAWIESICDYYTYVKECFKVTAESVDNGYRFIVTL